MAKTIISVDIKKPPTEQPQPLHNRWHPGHSSRRRPSSRATTSSSRRWTGRAARSRTTTTPPTSATATYRPAIIWSGRSRSPAPSPATSWSSTSSISGRSRGTSGAIPVSSRPQNGGGFLTDLFPEAAQGDLGLQGHLCELAPYPQGVASPPSPIPGLSAARRATSFWRNGTSAKRS